MFDTLDQPPDEGPTTFAQPGGSQSFLAHLAGTIASAPIEPFIHPEVYRDIFDNAERQTRLVDSAGAENQALETAYDQRIAAVKQATGIDLENPMRGGYSIEARKAIRDEVRANGMQPIDATGGVPEYQRRIFDQKLEALRQSKPDQTEALTFGDVNEQARGIAKGAATARTPDDANPITAFGASLAGGMWGSRRDPLFLGSLFLGPTSAAGKTVLARIASAGVRQGLFNAGMTAIEQPAVQQWRDQIGVESGVKPAIENVGLSFLFGAIPGALFRGAHEVMAARSAIERVVAGRPEPGDAAAAVQAMGAEKEPVAAVHMGEDMQAADKAVLSEPPPEGVAPQLHDDMVAAELKRADSPDEPSAAAVESVHDLQAGKDERLPEAQNIADRVEAAKPQTEHDAQVAADEAIDDIGRGYGVAHLNDQIAAETAARTESRAVATAPEAEKPARSDPLGKVPFVREDGTPTLLTPKAAAAQGERETGFAMLVRSCK